MAKIYVDDVPVAVNELHEVLGIDRNSIPKKAQRIFEINPDRVRKDENGNEKTPRRMGVPTKFTAFSPKKGMNVTVRYATEAVPNNKNGFLVTNYAPAQLWINGKEESINDDLVYQFMYIHPDCAQSPFKKIGDSFRYLFKDNEAIAKADLLKDEQEIRAMSIIIGANAWSMSQLRQVAKGMNIPGVDALSDSEVKNRLKTLAKNNPNGFFDNARSNSIQFNGLLRDAVDKNIVKMVPNNGFKRWFFVNEELCIIPTGSDEMNALREAVVRNPDLIPQIQTALEGRTVERELEKPELSQYFKTPDTNITRNEVSPNLNAENKEINALSEHQADIKLLAEQEDIELGGGDKMHFKRREKLVKYRTEVDAYKASLIPTE